MNHLEREAERAAAEIGMGHGKIAGREPGRQRQSQPSDPQGVTDAAKHQGFVLDRYPQRHPHVRAQMRVQIWPPLAASSVTVTTIGTPVSVPVGSGPPIRRASCASHQPARLKQASSTSPT